MSAGTVYADTEGAGSGLVGWWKMDDGVGSTTIDSSIDSSGVNTATLISNTSWTTGARDRGTGLFFNGTTNYLNVPTYSYLNPGTGDFSYTFWIKSNLGTAQQVIAQRLDGNNTINAAVGTTPSIIINTTGVYPTVTMSSVANTLVPADNWYHVAIVVDRDSASNTKIYVNDINKTSGTPTTGNGININIAATYRIGVIGAANSQFFSGTMDDVRIYNRALSSSEVSSIYQQMSLPPTVTAQAATNITESTATLNGTITSNDISSSTVRGFNYGTTDNYGQTASTTGTFGLGAFTQDITGLSCGTVYHFQASATNSGGVGTSTPDATFETSACPTAVPIVTTVSSVNVTATTTTMTGNITDTGGQMILPGDLHTD